MLVSFSIYVLTFEDEIRLAVINIKDTICLFFSCCKVTKLPLNAQCDEILV